VSLSDVWPGPLQREGDSLQQHQPSPVTHGRFLQHPPEGLSEAESVCREGGPKEGGLCQVGQSCGLKACPELESLLYVVNMALRWRRSRCHPQLLTTATVAQSQAVQQVKPRIRHTAPLISCQPSHSRVFSTLFCVSGQGSGRCWVVHA
jgi:hypothetical protein